VNWSLFVKTDLDRYRKTFFAEAADHLVVLEKSLLALEVGPHDAVVVDEAFRAAHSVKGGADAVGLPNIARFTHAIEGVLDQARNQTRTPRSTIDLLLEAVDVLGRLIAAARTDGKLPEGVDVTIDRLHATMATPAEYVIHLAPQIDVFRAGLDPLPLLRELAEQGEVIRTVLDLSRLPKLDTLDPESCYLSWTVYVRTTRSAAELMAIFAFARDNLLLEIEPVSSEMPTEPQPAPVSPPMTRETMKDAPSGLRTILPPPSFERAGLVADFCAEAADHLEAADRCLLTLDTDPTDREALNSVYRGVHSIKGVASMLGLKAVQLLAHEAENLLNLARDGKLLLRGPALEVVFTSVDTLKKYIALARCWAVERVPLAPDPVIPNLIASLRKICESGGSESRTPAAPVAPPPPPRPPEPVPQPVAQTQRSVSQPQPVAMPKPTPEPSTGPVAAAAKSGRGIDKETVRVDKERLDKLINVIGELVIAQSMAQEEFLELTQRTGGHSRSLEELSKISRDIQELSLSLRMIPLQGSFQKITRLVRDLSRKMNKPVELELHGEETELDKTVVDQLGDPLMHMVRNAIDHGLESPEERVVTGKPAEGRISLRAYHQSGNVYIELTDDGRGLDRDRIFAKAVEKGLVPEGGRLSDGEVYALIFAPGFSTATSVTDVSGRGVGMDVVRRNVEALQGNILIRTQPGKGTTFTIRLPLTLAIMDGLMVGLGEDVYVLPLLSVVESFRPGTAEVHTVATRGEVVNVRGEVVPLLRLHQLLHRPVHETNPCRGLVVLVEDQGAKYALLVDELLGQMQAVVKSLDANYQRVEGLAGATILGNGQVAMILDIHGLTQLHRQFGGVPVVAMTACSDHLFGETL
jgi:two-component system chemotaxis sensor kinase CheA